MNEEQLQKGSINAVYTPGPVMKTNCVFAVPYMYHIQFILLFPEKGSEYQTLVLNNGPFGNALIFFTAVFKTDVVS